NARGRVAAPAWRQGQRQRRLEHRGPRARRALHRTRAQGLEARERPGCAAREGLDHLQRLRTRIASRERALGLREVLFLALLVFLATDAQGRLRTRLEALDADRLATLFADAELAGFDLLQSAIDLVDERLFASAQPELKRLQPFARRQIHF